MATLRREAEVAAGRAVGPALTPSAPGSGGQYGGSSPSDQHQTLVAQAGRGSIRTGGVLPSAGGGTGSDSAPDRPVQTGQTSTSQREFAGPAPIPGELPTYEAPEEWTGERRAGEVQKSSALGIREARRSLTEAVAGLDSDPGGAFALRQALAQHGINIERTVAGARSEAYQKEQQDLSRRTHTADIEYQARINDRNLQFEASFNTWMNTAKDVSTTASTYTPYGDLTGGGTSKAGAGGAGGGGRSSGAIPRTTAEVFRSQIIREFGLLGA